MARLEIDLQAKGFKQVASDVSSVDKAMTSLQDKSLAVSKNIQTLTNSSTQLEGKLKVLRDQFASGSISQSQYEKASKGLSIALENVRGRIGTLQGQQRSLSSTLAQTTSEASKQGAALNRLKGYHESFSSGVRSTNTIAVEFSRIIQDAPYGLQGVANNIQQLTQNYANYARATKEAAAAQGQSVSSASLLRGALGSFLSPLNLLTIGISLVTAGWVAYEKYTQRSAKASEEAAKKKDDLVKSLGNVSTALYNAATASGSEIAKLQTLYKVATDVNVPMQARLKAVKDLKAEAPTYLKGLSDEAILAGDAKKAYDELTASIIATARARAAESRIGEKSAQQFAIDEANKALNKQLETERKINKEREKTFRTGNTGNSYSSINSVNAIEYGNQIGKVQSIEEKINKNLLDREKIQEEINDLADVAVKNQATITKGVKDQVVAGSKLSSSLTDYVSKLNDIEQKSIFSSNVATEETSLDKQIERIKQRYTKLGQDVDSIEKQGLSNTKTNANKRNEITSAALEARKQIEVSKGLEIAEATRVAEQKTADTIAGILEKANITRVTSREKDLQANNVYYNELENTYRNNAQILEAITEARRASESQINEKWNNKDLEDANKIQEKINRLVSKPFSSSATNDELKKELDKRLKQIQDFYTEIRKILQASGLPTIGLGVLETASKVGLVSNLPDNDNKKESKEIAKLVERGFRQGLDSLVGQIDDLGSNFYQVFSNTFSILAKSLGGIFNDIVSTSLSKKISDKFDSEDFKISDKIKGDLAKGIVAGAGLAGSIVSSISKPTDTVGQALGGALSGAAAGAAFGAPGAIVGGVLGAISGIFKSAEAKRQQKIQEEQLAEQRKLVALQERQSQLAYGSSIIGQQTVNGVVQGFDRDAFGNIEFIIAGENLKAVLDRANNKR